jgi:protein-S-isoprenylcysteine O-methyltransferase Ste14
VTWFILLRALVYATLFVGLLLVFVSTRILEAAGVATPAAIGPLQVTGMALAAAGGLIALWSILAFVFVGRGTAAPFDPPRRLVVSGPFRYVRNPIYIGAGLAMLGAAIYYGSAALLAYLGLLAVIIQLFVVWYEEPTLTRLFGAEYDTYRRRVRRWLPRI